MTMVVLSCILDLVIYKKRNLANLILYMELIQLLALVNISSTGSDYTDIFLFSVHCLTILSFYTDKGGQIIMTCVSLMV